jgi:hypothetical protein
MAWESFIGLIHFNASYEADGQFYGHVLTNPVYTRLQPIRF